MASIIEKLKQLSKVENSKVTNLSPLELVDVNMVTMYFQRDTEYILKPSYPSLNMGILKVGTCAFFFHYK